MKYLLSLAIAFIASLFCAVTAFAAETYVVEIQSSIQEVIGYLFAALGGLLIGLVGWLLDPNKGKLAKLKIDDITRGYIETAIRAGLQYAENWVRQRGRDVKNPDTEKEIIAVALNYVLPRIPDALKHFGIDETDLRAMIIARFSPNSSVVISTEEVTHAGASQ